MPSVKERFQYIKDWEDFTDRIGYWVDKKTRILLLIILTLNLFGVCLLMSISADFFIKIIESCRGARDVGHRLLHTNSHKVMKM